MTYFLSDPDYQREASRNLASNIPDYIPKKELSFGAHVAQTMMAPVAAGVDIYDDVRLAASRYAETTLKPIAKEVDAIFKNENSIENWLTQKQLEVKQSVEKHNPSIAATSPIANFVRGVVQIGGEAAIGTVATGGNPFAGAGFAVTMQMERERYNLKKQGVDDETADKGALLHGVMTGIGLVIPAGITGSFVKSATYGAVSNTAVGMADRAVLYNTLKEQYPEVAEHYQVMDGMSLATDLAIGALFGGMAKKAKEWSPEQTQSFQDAVAYKLTLQRQNELTATGMHTTGDSINANLEAVNKATEQWLSGDRVDVADTVARLSLIPDERRSAFAGMWEEARKIAEKEHPEIVAEIKAAERIADAIQKRSTETVDVREQARDGEKMAERDTKEAVAGKEEIEINMVRNALKLDPERMVHDPYTGEVAKASDILAKLDEEIRENEVNAKEYGEAIACFIEKGID